MSPVAVVALAKHGSECSPPDAEDEQDNLLDEADHDHNKDNLLFSEGGTLLLPGREIAGAQLSRQYFGENFLCLEDLF